MEIATLFVYFLCVIVGAIFLWNIIKIIRMTIPEREPMDTRTAAQIYMDNRDRIVPKKEVTQERPQEFTGIRAIQL